jgi:hypothetical protein
MDLDLVGYLYGLLDADDRRRAEAALRDNPPARARLDRLRRTLAPLAAGRDPGPPPAGLADRTLAFIAARTADRRPAPARRVGTTGGEPVFAPSRWRRIDVVIAAGILVMVGGLGLSGVGRVQQRHAVAACQNNLRVVGAALAGYSADHAGRFPQVAEMPPNNVAAAFVPMLQDSGNLVAAPACPGAGSAVPAGGYAYTLGFRGPDGRLYGLRHDPNHGEGDLLPIAADRPTPTAHGTGHNVLFIGGNVRFATTPKVGVDGDDIFINKANLVAAGLDHLDTVLGAGDTSP